MSRALPCSGTASARPQAARQQDRGAGLGSRQQALFIHSFPGRLARLGSAGLPRATGLPSQSCRQPVPRRLRLFPSRRPVGRLARVEARSSRATTPRHTTPPHATPQQPWRPPSQQPGRQATEKRGEAGDHGRPDTALRQPAQQAVSRGAGGAGSGGAQ